MFYTSVYARRQPKHTRTLTQPTMQHSVPRSSLRATSGISPEPARNSGGSPAGLDRKGSLGLELQVAAHVARARTHECRQMLMRSTAQAVHQTGLDRQTGIPVCSAARMDSMYLHSCTHADVHTCACAPRRAAVLTCVCVTCLCMCVRTLF